MSIQENLFPCLVYGCIRDDGIINCHRKLAIQTMHITNIKPTCRRVTFWQGPVKPTQTLAVPYY